MNRMKANVQLPEVTENRLLYENIDRNMAVCLGVHRHVCFLIDWRVQVLIGHSNKIEKLTLPDKIEVIILFEARTCAFFME